MPMLRWKKHREYQGPFTPIRQTIVLTGRSGRNLTKNLFSCRCLGEMNASTHFRGSDWPNLEVALTYPSKHGWGKSFGGSAS